MDLTPGQPEPPDQRRRPVLRYTPVVSGDGRRPAAEETDGRSIRFARDADPRDYYGANPADWPPPRRGASGGRALLALLATGALTLAGLAAGLIETATPVSPLAEGEAAAALQAVAARVGHPLHGLEIVLRSDAVVLLVQQPGAPLRVDRWRVQHLRLAGLIDWRKVDGPNPEQAAAVGPTTDAAGFDFAEADLAAVPRTVAAAVERVALEDPPSTAEVRIAKQRVLFPVERAGPVRWSIELRSPREFAYAYADAAGRLVGVSLGGTLRAKSMNLYDGGPDLAAAAKAFSDAFAGRDVVKEIRLGRTALRFLAQEAVPPAPAAPAPQAGAGFPAGALALGRRNAPAAPTVRLAWYTAGIDGVGRETIGNLMSPEMGLVDTRRVPFSAGEVDWSALPRLAAAARRLVGMADAPVTGVTVEKRARALRDPALEWAISLTGAGGERGEAVLAVDGTPRHLAYPGAAPPPPDMLAPATVAALARVLAEELGPHASVMEIMLTADQARILASDPRKPRGLVQLQWDGLVLDTERSPIDPAVFRPDYDAGWFFDLAELTPALLDGLGGLQQRTLAQLPAPGARLDRITFSKDKQFKPDNDRLLVEIRVEADAGKSGWIAWDTGGRAMQVMRP